MNNHLSDKTSFFLNSTLSKGGLRGVFFICALLLILSLFTSSAFATTTLTYEYDPNGNLIRGDGKYYEYNDANHLIRVRHGDASGPVLAEYVYDYTGQRIKKTENGITTYYIEKYFEKQVGSAGSTNTSYYFVNNERVAKKDSLGNFTYYHSDHLGGTNVITDSSGNFVERIKYYPFGEIREGGNEKYSFTGKEKDNLTDFYYFEARYYNPEFKHFTQADYVNPNLYDPQDLNRYAYVRNNPVKFIDPKGYRWFDVFKSLYEKTMEATSKTLGALREVCETSHFENVLERLSNFTSKTLSGLEVIEKAADTRTFQMQTSTRVDPRIDQNFSENSGKALNQLRVVENVGSFGLERLPAGTGAAGAGLLETHNLTERDAPRLFLDAYKAKNLVDVYSDPNATEEELRKAEDLYNNPMNSPYFPK